MTATVTDHELERASCYSKPNHCHQPYRPPTMGAKRCTCGARRFKLSIGGGMPPSVNCAECGRVSPVSTGYETGRADATPRT